MQKQSFLTQNDFWHKDYIVPAMFGIVECTSIDDEIKNENRRLAKFTVAIVFIVSILFIISIVISPSSDPKTIRWAWYIFAMALLIGETWIYIFFKKSALRTKESAPC